MSKVVVTGGTRGLGLGIACGLCDAGYEVVAVARRLSDEFISACAPEGVRSRSLHFVAYDLSDIDGIPDFARGLRQQFGDIFALVNNAGIGTSGVLATMNNAEIEKLVRLNTVSPIVLTKYMVRAMMTQGGGRIVNVSSIVAANGYGGLSVYSATKASLVGFTRSLAREVGRFGINVNAVAPGFIDTDMTSSLQDEHQATLVRRSALRRLPEIADVANAVEFLIGDKSRNITGTVLTIDSGTTA